MNILLTGSSGYIGSKLIYPLKKNGHIIHGIDREKELAIIDQFTQGDLCEKKTYPASISEFDQIYHLAAAKGDWGISEDEYYRDNLDATKVLINQGKKAGIKDWIFFSTVSALGPSHEPIGEKAEYNPIHPYGSSKAEAEKLFFQLAEEDPEARILIIRPSVVFGPENPDSTNIYRLIDSIYKGKFMMVGRGESLKSTSYIENLIQATLFLADRMEKGVQVYNYIDEPVISTDELVTKIYELLGLKRPSFYLPLSIAKPIAFASDIAASVIGIDFPITAARIEKFNTSTNFDASAIRKLGFEQPVSNEEALKKTVEWHLNQLYGQKLNKQ